MYDAASLSVSPDFLLSVRAERDRGRKFLSPPLRLSYSVAGSLDGVLEPSIMHTARPPLPQALLSSLQCLSRSRPFSQGLVRPLEPTRSIPKIRQNPLKSMKVATKDAMKNDAGMVNDIGLLPGMPIGRYLDPPKRR